MMKKEVISTTKAPAAVGPYSQAIKIGDFLYTSGQIALDPVTGVLAPAEIEAQSEQVMKNLGAVLEAAGYTFDDVIKTTCFLQEMGHFAAFKGAGGQQFIGNGQVVGCGCAAAGTAAQKKNQRQSDSQ